MEILAKYKKLNLCASNDECRHVINHIILDKDSSGDPVAVATDGRRLVCVPLDKLDEREVGKLIHRSAWKDMFRHRVGRKVENIPLKFKVLKRWVQVFVRNGDAKTDPVQLKEIIKRDEVMSHYPKWQQVVEVPGSDKITCINPKFLYEMAQSMGCETVKIRFADEHSAIRVTPYHDDNKAYGMLMPVRMP